MCPSGASLQYLTPPVSVLPQIGRWIAARGALTDRLVPPAMVGVNFR